MPNQLDLPEELQHLIEKRDDGQRRERTEPAPESEGSERRQAERRADDAGQSAADAE